MRSREIREEAKQISFAGGDHPVACAEDICKLVSKAVKDEASKWKKILLDSSGQVIEESVNDAKSEKRRIIKKLVSILNSELKKVIS